MTLNHPFRDLSRFPQARLDSGHEVWRVIADRYETEPWFFGNAGANRFDLHPESPRGTCYLADHPYGALLETVLRDVEPTGDPGIQPPLPPAKVADRHLQCLRLPKRVMLAKLTPDESVDLHTAYGINAMEMCSATTYERPQQWAQALDTTAPVNGIRYRLRHSNHLATALFGDVGVADWPGGERHEIGPDAGWWSADQWAVARLGPSTHLTVHDAVDDSLHE